MEARPLPQGALANNSTGIGPVTRAMVHRRTQELALLAGCTAPHVRQCDYEQAKRELTGESDLELQNALLDSLPVTNHSDPVPATAGRRAAEAPGPAEGPTGRSVSRRPAGGAALLPPGGAAA